MARLAFVRYAMLFTFPLPILPGVGIFNRELLNCHHSPLRLSNPEADVAGLWLGFCIAWTSSPASRRPSIGDLLSAYWFDSEIPDRPPKKAVPGPPPDPVPPGIPSAPYHLGSTDARRVHVFHFAPAYRHSTPVLSCACPSAFSIERGIFRPREGEQYRHVVPPSLLKKLSDPLALSRVG